MMKMEFCGGPADGDVREVEEGTTTVIIYQLDSEPGAVWHMQQPDAVVGMQRHAYRWKNRRTKRGHRAYDYAGRVYRV